jgi:hypothetical protein
MCQISCPFSFAYVIPKNLSESDALRNILYQTFFYGNELLVPRPTSKLEDHPLSAVRDCLFQIFTATIHVETEDAPCRDYKGPT